MRDDGYSDRLLERGEFLEGEEGQWHHGFQRNAEDMLKQCRFWLAENYRAQGKFFQAGLQYRALLQIMPPDENALIAWIEMLVRQGKPQEALKCYQDVKDFVEAQGFPLSLAWDTIEQQIKVLPPPTLRFSFSITEEPETTRETPALSEKAVSLWPILAVNQSMSSYHAAWPFFSNSLATHPDVLYDALETEIFTLTLQCKQSSDSIMTLQRSVHAAIRKYDTMHKDQPNHEINITRRNALQAIAILPVQAYGLKLFLPEMHLPPSEEMIPLYAAGIAACWEMQANSDPEGMLASQRFLAFYLPMLEKIARQSLPSRKAAACLAAQGYLLASVLANHHGKPDQMEAASRMARLYGQIAQDPNLEVSALIRLAVKFDTESHEAKALKTYQEAAALPDFSSVSPLLRGRVYAGLAGTHAHCGQASQALFFLSQAKETYPSNPESDPSFSFAICSPDVLTLYEGLTLKHAHRYTEATSIFSRIGSLTPLPGVPETNRSESLIYAASVAIESHNLETAYAYLDTAEEIAWNIRHEYLQTEVRNTFLSIRLLWPNEPKVKVLQEKIHSRQ